MMVEQKQTEMKSFKAGPVYCQSIQMLKVNLNSLKNTWFTMWTTFLFQYMTYGFYGIGGGGEY